MKRFEKWFWEKGEAVWRASRTARQVMWGVFAAALLAALVAYQQTHVFPWEMLWYDGVVLAVATAIAYLQNRAPKVDLMERIGGTD